SRLWQCVEPGSADRRGNSDDDSDDDSGESRQGWALAVQLPWDRARVLRRQVAEHSWAWIEECFLVKDRLSVGHQNSPGARTCCRIYGLPGSDVRTRGIIDQRRHLLSLPPG